MNTLEQDHEYYVKHQKELAEKYAGKFVVIKNAKVEGVYSTEIEAYEDAKDKFELGTFIIKPVLPVGSNETQVFHTRAYL